MTANVLAALKNTTWSGWKFISSLAKAFMKANEKVAISMKAIPLVIIMN